MRLHEGIICKKLFFLIILLQFSTNGNASVGIYSNFYNSDNSLKAEGYGENMDFQGSVTLLPCAGFSGYPYSIYAEGAGRPNGKLAPTEYAFGLSASGNGKTVFAESRVQEDPLIKTALSCRWGYKTELGNPGTGGCTLYQFIDIKSYPGYLTFPTSDNLDTITAGMIFDAKNIDGQTLLKKHVPMPEYCEYPLTLGAIKGEHDNVHMEDNLKIFSQW